MARPRKPTALLTGDYTHEARDDHEARELKVVTLAVEPPGYLTVKLAGEFDKLARRLLSLGILTDLDADILAMYLVHRENWIVAERDFRRAVRGKDPDASEKADRRVCREAEMVRKLATQLGLTVSSRCNLAIPDAPKAVEW